MEIQIIRGYHLELQIDIFFILKEKLFELKNCI